MPGLITANELKVKGVQALDEVVSDQNEAVITVHGKQRFVVLSIDEYNRLRECELEAAIQESRRDIESGRFQAGSVEDHLARISGA